MAFVAAPGSATPAAAAAAPATALRPAVASAFVARPARHARLPGVAPPPRVTAAAGVQMAMAVGAPAPPFTLPTDGGGELSLADLRGKKVVLYFCTFFRFLLLLPVALYGSLRAFWI